MRLLIVGAFLALAGQEKYQLEARQEAGDVFKSTRSEIFAGRSKLLTDTKGVTQEDSILARDEAASTNTVLEANQGVATKVERKFEKYSFETKLFGSDKPEKGKRALQGKTVTISKEGKFEGAEGVGEEELAKIKLIDDPLIRSLPKDAVGVGHKWDIDEKALKEFFSAPGDSLKLSKATASCVFEKLEDKGGIKCAVIKIQMKVEAEGENKHKLVTESKGTMWIALAEKRYMGLDLEGKYTTQASNADEELVMEGSGRMSINETIKYEKLGGSNSTSDPKK